MAILTTYLLRCLRESKLFPTKNRLLWTSRRYKYTYCMVIKYSEKPSLHSLYGATHNKTLQRWLWSIGCLLIQDVLLSSSLLRRSLLSIFKRAFYETTWYWPCQELFNYVFVTALLVAHFLQRGYRRESWIIFKSLTLLLDLLTRFYVLDLRFYVTIFGVFSSIISLTKATFFDIL